MIESCFTSILFWQIFTAQINQVFPAEDDVNKHVEDNCEFTAQTLLLFYQKSPAQGFYVSYHHIKFP